MLQNYVTDSHLAEYCKNLEFVKAAIWKTVNYNLVDLQKRIFPMINPETVIGLFDSNLETGQEQHSPRDIRISDILLAILINNNFYALEQICRLGLMNNHVSKLLKGFSPLHFADYHNNSDMFTLLEPYCDTDYYQKTICLRDLIVIEKSPITNLNKLLFDLTIVCDDAIIVSFMNNTNTTVDLLNDGKVANVILRYSTNRESNDFFSIPFTVQKINLKLQQVKKCKTINKNSTT